MKQWYAVFAKPSAEGVAEENLQRQGFDVYLPRCCRSRRSKGRWIDRIEPLFPRYLFIRLDPATDNAAVIRSTRGVIGLVRFGDRLGVVPERFMEGLKAQRDGETGLHRLARAELHRGDRVTVTDGVFAGLEGIFQSMCGLERVAILMKLMGRESRIEIPRQRVLPAT